MSFDLSDIRTPTAVTSFGFDFAFPASCNKHFSSIDGTKTTRTLSNTSTSSLTAKLTAAAAPSPFPSLLSAPASRTSSLSALVGSTATAEFDRVEQLSGLSTFAHLLPTVASLIVSSPSAGGETTPSFATVKGSTFALGEAGLQQLQQLQQHLFFEQHHHQEQQQEQQDQEQQADLPFTESQLFIALGIPKSAAPLAAPASPSPAHPHLPALTQTTAAAVAGASLPSISSTASGSFHFPSIDSAILASIAAVCAAPGLSLGNNNINNASHVSASADDAALSSGSSDNGAAGPHSPSPSPTTAKAAKRARKQPKSAAAERERQDAYQQHFLHDLATALAPGPDSSEDQSRFFDDEHEQGSTGSCDEEEEEEQDEYDECGAYLDDDESGSQFNDSSDTLSFFAGLEGGEEASGAHQRRSKASSSSSSSSSPIDQHKAEQRRRRTTLRYTEWPDEILHMSTCDLNRHLKTRSYTPEQIKDLRKLRRRIKNRGYAKKARKEKALQKVENGAMCEPEMKKMIARLQADLSAAQARESTLFRIVQKTCPTELQTFYKLHPSCSPQQQQQEEQEQQQQQRQRHKQKRF